MKEILNRLLLFSLGLTFYCFLHAQDQVDFKSQVKKIDSLVESRSFDEALTEIETTQEAITNTSIGDSDSTRLYFLSKLAFINYQLGDCENTIFNSRQEVALRDSIYGQGDALFLSSLRNLGIYQLNCDSLEKADSTVSLVLELHRENIGQIDEVYVKTLDDLAFIKSKKGEIEKSSAMYEELLDILKNNKGSFYYGVLDSYVSHLINYELFQEALPFYPDLKEWSQGKPDYAQFLKDFYNIFIFTRDYVKVFETASELISLTENEVASEIILNAARAAFLMSKYDHALEFYTKAYNAYSDSTQLKILIHLEKADVLDALSKNFQQVRELLIAKHLHEQNSITDSSTYSRTILRMGTIYTEIGDFESAEKLFADYINELEKQPTIDYLKLAQAYQSLGNQKYLLKDFNEADLNLNKAEKILVENDFTSSSEYASSLNSLGALKEAIGDYEAAKIFYRKAFNITTEEDVSLRLKVASASNYANIINSFNPENDTISILYSKAIEWQKQLTGEQHPDYGNLLNKRGLAYQRNNELVLAQSDYELAKQVLEYTVSLSHPEYLVSMSNLGHLYSEKGELDKALEIMLETKGLYETHYSSNNPGYILTVNNLANLYTKREEYAKAEELFLMLADIELEEITKSFSYLSESEKKTFVEEKKKFLDNLKKYIVVRYVEAQEDVNSEVLTKWFELELNVKGILLNSTKKVRDQIFNGGNQQLIELFSNWTLAREQVADLQSLKSDQSKTSQAQLDSLTLRIGELEKEISRTSADFGATFSTSNISYQNIRNSLGPGECAIEIVRIPFGDEIVYIALYMENTLATPELIVIGKGSPLDNKSFSTYKNSISYKVSNSVPFESYWRPLQERLNRSDISKIYFTPDGIYHKVSIATLYDADNKEFVLDKYELVQLTSSKDILNARSGLASNDNSTKKMLLMGRPNYTLGGNLQTNAIQTTRSFSMGNITDLPGTEEEVLGINEVVSGKELEVVNYLGDKSSEVNFKEHLDSDIIHIATHGFFFEKEAIEGEAYLDPMLYSGLLLAGVSDKDIMDKTGEDGILTAYEIMNLNFSKLDMVILSACETGTGQISSGEGVYGLQRAFFVAGANTLIMSLWKVDDQATKDLMTNFYKELIKSGDKRAAFIDAQKKVKKKYKSPIYWGAFVMVGS